MVNKTGDKIYTSKSKSHKKSKSSDKRLKTVITNKFPKLSQYSEKEYISYISEFQEKIGSNAYDIKGVSFFQGYRITPHELKNLLDDGEMSPNMVGFFLNYFVHIKMSESNAEEFLNYFVPLKYKILKKDKFPLQNYEKITEKLLYPNFDIELMNKIWILIHDKEWILLIIDLVRGKSSAIDWRVDKNDTDTKIIDLTTLVRTYLTQELGLSTKLWTYYHVDVEKEFQVENESKILRLNAKSMVPFGDCMVSNFSLIYKELFNQTLDKFYERLVWVIFALDYMDKVDKIKKVSIKVKNDLDIGMYHANQISIQRSDLLRETVTDQKLAWDLHPNNEFKKIQGQIDYQLQFEAPGERQNQKSKYLKQFVTNLNFTGYNPSFVEVDLGIPETSQRKQYFNEIYARQNQENIFLKLDTEETQENNKDIIFFEGKNKDVQDQWKHFQQENHDFNYVESDYTGAQISTIPVDKNGRRIPKKDMVTISSHDEMLKLERAFGIKPVNEKYHEYTKRQIDSLDKLLLKTPNYHRHDSHSLIEPQYDKFKSNEVVTLHGPRNIYYNPKVGFVGSTDQASKMKSPRYIDDILQNVPKYKEPDPYEVQNLYQNLEVKQGKQFYQQYYKNQVMGQKQYEMNKKY